MEGGNTEISNTLMIDLDHFKAAYDTGGAGTYTGTWNGDWTKSISDEDIAEAVSILIAALPEKGTVASTDQIQIENARTAYSALTSTQQALVVGLASLKAAEAELLVLTNLSALEIGDNYGGGIVAYIFQSEDAGYVVDEVHGLIAATADQGTGIAWSNLDSTLVSATGTAIGTGQANTNAIVGYVNSESGAAKVCDDYSITVNSVTYSDWYLPSIDELNQLYLNQVAVGGFSSYSYWSSSEGINISAWFENFSTGYQDYYQKINEYSVRAVRTF